MATTQRGHMELVIILAVSFMIAIYLVAKLSPEKGTWRTDNEQEVQFPELDTSHMVAIDDRPMLDAEDLKMYGGTFGNRYCHMMVIDRDGMRYMCFMTEYNLRALWEARFEQGGYTPSLVEQEDDFMIGDVKIGVYPFHLSRHARNSAIWLRWAALHEEFNQFRISGGNYFTSFEKYFEYHEPREIPLEAVSA